MQDGELPFDSFADAMLAAQLLAADLSLGGMVLRGDGPARDAIVAELARLMPIRKLPPNIDAEGLIGGRDLTALLAGQGDTIRPGVMAMADGGVLLVPYAERLRDDVAAQIVQVLDTGEVAVGDLRYPARFALVLLDNGGEDEAIPSRLEERLAFRLDLTGARQSGPDPVHDSFGEHPSERCFDPDQCEVADLLKAVASTCSLLGIDSVRAPLFALRAARQTDIATAARLVLAHRATRLPVEDETPPPPENAVQGDTVPLDDVVLDAVKAALPPDVLAAIASGQSRRSKSDGRHGLRRRSPTRGRPLGARGGLPRGGARLAIVDTLRAAAPWQRMRRADGAIKFRKDDLRIKRFESRTGATAIFAVDASGSAAAARLAEAKGAVELLLAEAYAKRTEVALVAFRGEAAEVLLPPTRSLTRARKLLSDLPGGGTTPLAHGIEAARVLADGVRAKGRTPIVVLLSDGRGNVGQGGDPQSDAERAARLLRAGGVDAVFIDIAPRPRAEAASLATAMGARYLPMPRADAAALHAAVAQAL